MEKLEFVEFRDVLAAKESGDAEKLNETSLKRVYQHVSDNEKSLGIMTAFKEGISLKENRSRNKRLMSDIRSLGLGAFRLFGSYVLKTKEKVVEESFGIPGIEEKALIRLGKKYKKESVLWIPAEDDIAYFLYMSGGKKDRVGKFNPMKISQYMSKVRGGSSFVFEYIAQTPTEGLIERVCNDRYALNRLVNIGVD